MSSRNLTASIPSPSPSPSDFFADNQKLDIESVRSLIAIINQHMHAILGNTESHKALKLKCTSNLNIQSQEFFEFSEHSVLSNLYYGIDETEAAGEAKCVGERRIKLENSEKMLQVPASLDENGVTLGIANSYLICCSYFYLSIVEVMRENEWQMAMHFLQAVLVSPRLVYTEFAPGICQSLFPLFLEHKVEESFDDFDDVMRWIARRYKPWLMYYQIMSSVDVCPRNRCNDAM